MMVVQQLISRKLFTRGLFILYVLLLVYAFTNNNPRCLVLVPDMENLQMFPGVEAPPGKPCKVNINSLGVVEVDLSTPNLTKIESENKLVELGGRWSPKDCSQWQLVAIIIPYRDRWEHLLILLRRLHPMLRKQKINYHIFLVEQGGNEIFNKGRVMNAGVLEARKLHPFNCFIFHDVDMLPENDKNFYYCDSYVHHLSPALDEFRYHVMYYNLIGGVAALSYENVLKVNGFSNQYWGWGAEDDDFSARTMEAGLFITRPPNHIGRYKMVRHHKRTRANYAYDLLMTWRSRWKTDGINSLDASKYKILKIEKRPLFTRIIVDVGKAPLSPPNLNGVPRESYFWFLSFYFP